MVEFITMAPTGGDGEYVGAGKNKKKNIKSDWTIRNESGDRQPTFEYIKEIAQAAEEAGFATLLLPTGQGCLDSLAVASSLVTQTTDLNFLLDRKSTRLNSSHVAISYAVFCLKKKKTISMTS